MDGEPGDGGSNFETPEYVHPETLEPETPNFILQSLSFLGWLVTSYGWPCLLLAIASAVLWRKYSPAVEQWKKQREEEQEAAMYHKNPDLFLAREAAVEKARQRLQEQYEQQAKEFAEKQKEKEAQKQRERIAAYDSQMNGSGGRRVGTSDAPSATTEKKTEKKKPTSFRSDFYPLMGAGGSSGFRAARRSARSGG